MRMLRRLAVGIVLLVLVLGGLAYALLAAPFTQTLRQQIAAEILTAITDEPAQVFGRVDVTIKSGVNVLVEDAVIGEADATVEDDIPQRFDTVEFRIPYDTLLGVRRSISGFKAAGLSIRVAQAPRREGTVQAEAFGGFLARLPSEFLALEVARDFSLTDAHIRYVDRDKGWRLDIKVNSLTSRLESNEIRMILDGSLNGEPLRVEMAVDEPSGSSETQLLGFRVDYVGSGIEIDANGTLDVSSPEAVFNLALSAMSPSLGDLIESYGIARSLDGTGQLKGQLKGTLNAMQVSGLDGSFETFEGHKMNVTGRFGDLTAVSGSDLEIAVDLPPLTQDGPSEGSLYDFEMSGFEFKVVGSLEEFEIPYALIKTNITDVDFEDIGPISVGRVFKDDQNKVSLQDIVVQDGPEDDPFFVLSGHLDDLFAFKGLVFDGWLRLPTAKLLEGRVPDATALGRVSGTVSMTDKDGKFGIDALALQVEDTDLIELQASLAVRDLRALDGMALVVDKKIPNLQKFAAAIGVPVKAKAGLLAFEGALALGDTSLSADGSLQVQKSAANVSLKLSNVENAPSISGAITSKRIVLSDVQGLIEFFKSVRLSTSNNFDLDEEIVEDARVTMDFNIGQIVGAKKATGKAKGTLRYANETLTLSSMSLGYLGGTISGTFGANFRGKAPSYSAKGRIDKWRMGRLLGELGLSAPVTGTLFLSFDVATAGRSFKSFGRNLSGRFSGSLWGGTIPGRVIDLSGLNLVTWLFAKKNPGGSSKIVCAVFPLKFKNGNGFGKSMIIETENVQIVGGGSINLRAGTLDLSFVPRAKRVQAVDMVTPIEINGPIGKPKLTVRNVGAGRALGEVITLPINLIGRVFGGDRPVDKSHKPCTLPKVGVPK